MSEDKVRTKDSCWPVEMIYDPRGLPGVCTVGPKVERVLQIVSESGVDGVLQMVSIREWMGYRHL
jgi:hypothetical protein